MLNHYYDFSKPRHVVEFQVFPDADFQPFGVYSDESEAMEMVSRLCSAGMPAICRTLPRVLVYVLRNLHNGLILGVYESYEKAEEVQKGFQKIHRATEIISAPLNPDLKGVI